MAGTAGAGTRGGAGRIAAMAIGLGAVLALALAGEARAGTYDVAQCGWSVGVELDPRVAPTEGDAAYLRPGFCTAPSAEYPGLAFDMGQAYDGTQGIARARWAAPPGTSFVGASFNWAGSLAVAVVQLALIADDRGFESVALEVGTSAPRHVVSAFSTPVPIFEARIQCLLLGPEGCVRSVPSSMWLNDLTLTVDDPVPPKAQLGGALVGSGWHRGTVPLEIAGEDPAGAGLYREEASVDGAPVFAGPIACSVASIEGEVRATRLRPCPPTASQAFEVDTRTLADGVHVLRGCAVDFGGGQGCAATAAIQVDNSAPGVEFAAAPEGAVAASVTDPFSGPAAGTISVRRGDSEAWTDLPTVLERGSAGTVTLRAQVPDLAPGTYYFRASATDGAGNGGSAQLRAAGAPAEVRRQVAGGGDGGGNAPAPRGGRAGARGRATHLVAHLTAGSGGRRDGRSDRGGAARLTVDHGTAARVRGRLTNAHGRGVPDRPVVVVARVAGGVGGAPERHRVVTDRRGAFESSLPPGTSRRVVVSFHGGGGFDPSRHRPLALRVRAAVSLTAEPLRLRTGESVALSGLVRPGAARIPARGKLVTIQFLDHASGRWRPALVVRTGARGRFKARYRFRYITGAARIRLRATALPEAGWPYAAGSSPPVTLEVHG
ncbi:MAG: hypothetical protein JST59_25570 [Actinobacteria bacterium]|nr:hypothetical protein [Actinomycetota bacterium]